MWLLAIYTVNGIRQESLTRDVALENALDLDLIYEENDPDFFKKQGVKRGTAKRFVRDIRRWAKRLKDQESVVISVAS